MVVLRRIRGKQSERSGFSSKPSASSKRTRKTLMKKPAGKKTDLQTATGAGIVVKAPRPFALFCKARGVKVQAASKEWKALSAEQKQVFVDESKELFEKQRRESLSAGIQLRGEQVKGTDLAGVALSHFAKKASPSPFALFAKDLNVTFRDASTQWQKLSDLEKGKYKEMAKAHQPNSHQKQAASTPTHSGKASNEGTVTSQSDPFQHLRLYLSCW